MKPHGIFGDLIADDNYAFHKALIGSEISGYGYEEGMKEASEVSKEAYKKVRSSKDDKEHSHPTEHDESDDLEMVKAIKEKE